MSNIVVKIPEIEGEATLLSYEGQIQCHAMQHGIDLPVVKSAASRTEGASMHSSIALTHNIDKASPGLRLHACQTTNLGKVVITRFRMVGQESKPAEIVTLGNAEVVAVYLDTPVNEDGTGADERPIETFLLDYEEIKWEFKHYKNGIEQGTVGGSYSTKTLSKNVSTV